MKVRNAAFLVGAGLAVGSVAAEAVDGFQWGQSWWAPYNALTAQYWEDGVVARDGGVAYFTGTSSPTLDFTSARTLRGIDFGQTKLENGRPVISGGLLTLAGEAFLGGTGQGSNSSGWDIFAVVNSTVAGTGANTLTKRDLGILRLDTPAPFANFGTVAAGGGFLRALPFSGALFAPSETAFAVRGGTFQWWPATNATATAAAATMGATTYGRFGGSLAWSKGANETATLTLASLAAEDAAGSTLALEPSGGAAALGETERILVTAPPATANGLLDPGIVVREEGVESGPFRFTKYDAVKGVVPVTVAEMTDLATAGAEDVAVVTATNALETSKRVAALSLENTATLSISNGVTLAVGDGEHPAGVAFNMQSQTGNDEHYPFAGDGTLDFGASPGVFWASSPTFYGWGGNRVIQLRTRITGSSGVTLASRPRDNAAQMSGIFSLGAGAAAWTGPTFLNGAMLWVGDGSALPSGDIHILNGSGLGGTLRFDSAATLNQNFHLAGRGCFGDSPGALELADGYSTFNGTVTLEDDTWLGYRNNGRGGVHFRGAVKGPGSLILVHAGTHNLYATNTFADLRVLKADTAINLVTNGTLGTGRVWVRAKNLALGIREAASAVITNRFRCESPVGTLALHHAAATLDTDVTVARTVFTNFSSLAIGGTVDLGAFSASGARDTTFRSCYDQTTKALYTAWLKPEGISAARAGAEVRLGSAEDGVLAVPLADGAGTLAFTKQGAGALELPAGVTNAYSGATTVAAGTLKLNGDPLASKSLVWWLDASREQDFDKAADGTVTNWHSRAGSAGITFTALGTKPTWGAQTVNGLPVVTMGASSTQLKGDRKAWHRTVFQVCRMREPASFACTFGAPTTEFDEYGIRLNGAKFESSWEFDKVAHYISNTTGKGRIDGQSKDMACGRNARILVSVHDRDNWGSSVSWARPTRTPHFTPMLNYHGGRPFYGDYAEVIAFDRVLSETEIRRVENYLSEKWLGRKIWTDAQLAAPATLPAATALDVATGATLDLNGVSATVASLVGGGTITNSSATAATLTVTGTAAFTGRVGGAVTLATRGAAALGAIATAGATLAATGGTLETGTHVFTPSAEGLAYWCDAGRPETVLRNESGAVTSWVSRAASSAAALVNPPGSRMPGSNASKDRPVFTEACRTAMDGRPGVYFANQARALWADVKTPVRTVFIVAMLSAKQNNCNGLWGIAGVDIGFRFSNNTTSMEGAGSVVRPTARDDRVRMDGLDTFNFGENRVRVFSARFESASEEFFGSIGLQSPTPSRTTTLGAYSGNPGIEGYVGEVIAYDRVLPDAEMLRVERYLANKWQETAWTGGEPPAETAGTFAGGALAVGAGASATVPDGTSVGVLSGGGTLAGDVTAGGFDVTVKGDGTTDTLTVDGALTLAEGAFLTVRNQESLVARIVNTFVRATSVSGGFAGTNLSKRNDYSLSSTEGRVYRIPGLTVIVR